MAGKVKERKLDCKSQWKGKACMGFAFLALRAFLCKSPHLLHFLQFHHRIHKIHELGAKLMEKRTKLWLGKVGKVSHCIDINIDHYPTSCWTPQNQLE